MEHLIRSALKGSGQDGNAMRRAPNEKDKDLESILGAHRTRIRVVGCGGGGNNTVTRLMEVGVVGVETLAVNTDAQDLLYATADEKILIGRSVTNGLGAGSDPKIGEDSALENQKDLEEALKNSDLVFVTCGLGGGTGTGSAPIVAEIARKLGALTISIVTLPFSEEGILRWENARRGLEKLRKNSDTVIVVQNDRLLEIVPEMSLNDAFKVADEILVNGVRGITELVTEKGLVNLDFADIRAIMQNGGTALIGMGESPPSAGGDQAREAVEMAINNPLLDVDITGATSALINITGGAEMSLKDAKTVMKTVAEKLDPGAKVIWGARLDEQMKNTIRVMLIVTGLRDKRRASAEIDRLLTNETPRKATGSGQQTTGLWSQPPSQESPLVEDKEKSAEAGSGSAVFSKIFEEEARPDLKILRQSIAGLVSDRSNEAALRGIKNAALAINNSAQLFAFNQIADFATVVEEVCSRALSGDIPVSGKLAKLYEEVPDIFEGMITGRQDAHSRAEQLAARLRRVRDWLDAGGDDVGSDEGWGDEGSTRRQSEIARTVDIDDMSPRSGPDGEKLSRVGEAVEYVKGLFGSESGKPHQHAHDSGSDRLSPD